MITNLYTIYDMDTAEYSPIFHSANDASAIRSFCLSMKDAPEVYKTRTELYYIGRFDSSTGFIINLDDDKINTVVFSGSSISDWFKEREKIGKTGGCK